MSEAVPGEQLLKQILGGSAPERLRAAAARGALPLPRTDLAQIFLFLREDENEEIKSSAKASLGELDTETLKEILGDPSCAPEVLTYFAPNAARDESLAEQLAFNQAVPVQALATLALTGKSAVVDLVLTNQERLLANPQLLEHLMTNPILRADQRGRILEILDTIARTSSKLKAGQGDAGAEPRDTLDLEDVANLLQVDVGELLASSEIIDAEEFAYSEKPEIRDAFARIMTLSTGAKAILAMKGGREERRILIRDSNKIVSLGVLRNPRITDSEIAVIAGMRNVNEHVLRQLANNRNWTKTAKVARTLVHNPRTPPTVSSNFVHRLTNRDLKMMKNNHEVPELVRMMCRRLLEKRTRPKKGFRK
jgi:hypothetical protein